MNKVESMNIHVKKHSKNDLHNLVSMKGSYTNNHRLDAKWIENLWVWSRRENVFFLKRIMKQLQLEQFGQVFPASGSV